MRSVSQGRVRWEPVRSLWFTGMALGAVVGGALTFSWAAFAVFVAATVLVLLLGHSLGMHRKLVHDSFDCPRWLEYLLVWLGTQVGLAGPLSMVRTHDLRDFAQRLPDCHDFLAHRRGLLVDAWWQLHTYRHELDELGLHGMRCTGLLITIFIGDQQVVTLAWPYKRQTAPEFAR